MFSTRTLDFFCRIPVLQFDERAANTYQRLTVLKVRIGTQDLLIAAIAGSSDPTAMAAAVAALGAQLGVNLLADIIGNRPAPPTLTVELMRRWVALTHPVKSFH